MTARAGAAGPTAVAATGSALAMVSLRAVFGDWMWLLEAWAALAIVVALLCALRAGRAARVWHDMAAFVVLAGFLVATHLPTGSVAGVIPTGATMQEVSDTLDRAGAIIETSRPGLDSTASLRLITTLTLVALAIAIDLLAVVARLRALSGLAFLALVTCAGAIGRGSIGLIAFICAGGGYLLVLASGMALERQEWTESAAVHGAARRSGIAGGGSGGRIAAGAIAVAIIVPALVPLASDGLLSGMFARGAGGEGAGSASLSAFAKLRGTLNQSQEIDLLSVEIIDGMVSNDPTVNPFYLRQIVLDDYASNEGWSPSGAGEHDRVGRRLDSELDDSQSPGRPFVAVVDVLGLDDTSVPLFGTTEQVTGLGQAWRWNTSTGTIDGSRISGGRQYTVQFTQPEPQASQLQGARVGQGDEFARWLALPGDVPAQVASLAADITALQIGPYAKARALSEYFTNPANGYTYTTQTDRGDSGDALVDFLVSKKGFCQQYAAAMGVMLRTLGIPARLVLGYTHQKPDDNNRFLVTSRDAHAWVEVYFEGFGWLPFDPTPLTGSNAGRDIPVPYAPDPGSVSATPGASASGGTNSQGDPLLEIPLVPDEVSFDAGTPFSIEEDAPASGRPYALYAGVGAGILLVALLAPAAARVLLRRRRMRAARSGATAWPWWQEYRAVAGDLGQQWPDATTLREAPRLVGELLPQPAGEGAKAVVEAATALAVLVERERFGPQRTGGGAAKGAPPNDPLSSEARARAAIRELRASYPLRARLAARWWPGSVRRAARAAMSRRIRLVLAGPQLMRDRVRRAG